MQQTPALLSRPASEGQVAARQRRVPQSRVQDLACVDQPIRRARTAVVLVLACVAVSSLPWYPVYGLSFAWTTVGVPAFAVIGVFGLFSQIARNPRTLADRAIADTVLVAGLLLLATNLASPAQYLAVALRQPLIDPWLAAADALVGIDVSRLAGWTASRPGLALVFWMAYSSLIPQFLGALLLLGLYYKDRVRLWEYCFHFHFCLMLTLLGLALFPAACAFQYLGFDSVLPQDRFIAHFNGLRDGSFTTLRFNDLEGLISMPSFHVAGGLMVTWAFRSYRIPLAVLTILNSLMITATFMTGAHYLVDVLGTMLVFGLSIAVFRTITNHAHEPAASPTSDSTTSPVARSRHHHFTRFSASTLGRDRLRDR